MTRPRNQIAPPAQPAVAPTAGLARTRAVRWLLIIAVLWLAFALRVWQLDTLPPGLHYDEAFNGTMAREIIRGINRPIFFTDNFGQEPLHMYAEALMLVIAGESPWSIRLTSVFFGVVLVAALYACARAFFRSYTIALVSAFLCATLLWPLVFSRIGIETGSLPPTLTLSAAAIAWAYRHRTWGWMLAAGFLTGAVIYTYLASRLWPLAVFLWFVYLAIFHRRVLRDHLPKWAGLAVVFLLTIAPLGLFFVANPVALAGRSGTVFTPESIAPNVLRTAGMFFFSGDTDPRDNLAGRAALDIVLAVLFIIGSIRTLRRLNQPLYALLAIWFVVMCLPSALTEFAPNFRRAIGAMPATILLCALGFEWLWQLTPRLAARTNEAGRASFLQTLARGGLLLLLALSAFWSGRAYFVDWASGTGLFYSFDAGILKVAQALAARPAGEDLYLSPNYGDHYTVIWALDGRPVSTFDGRRALVLPHSGRVGTYGIITHEDDQTLAALDKYQAHIEPLQQFADQAGAPYAQLLQVSDAQLPSQSLLARVDDFGELRVLGAVPPTARPEDTLLLTLDWNALKSAPRDYVVFVQVLGAMNPQTGTPIWAQDDGQPGNGTYPTTKWQSGQSVIETHTLKLPPELPAGDYEIKVGMYSLETGERVSLWGPDGTRLTDDAVSAGAFRVP